MEPCQYSDQLSPYLDGELSADQRLQVERHLGGCTACDAEMAELRGLSRLFVEAGPILPAGMMARLHQNISELEEEQEQADRNSRRILRFSRLLTGLAACLLIAGSIWMSHKPTNNPSVARVVETPAAAPWDEAAATVDTPVQSETVAPADVDAKWMTDGLVSASLLPGQDAGEEEQP